MAIALEVVRLCEKLPKTSTASVLGRQLLRSGTSVGANYRAACRARSDREMYAKLAIVEEEADESVYWLELLLESQLVEEGQIRSLLVELDQVIAMTVTSKKTLARRTRSIQSNSSGADAPRAQGKRSAEYDPTGRQSTIDNRQW